MQKHLVETEIESSLGCSIKITGLQRQMKRSVCAWFVMVMNKKAE